MSPHIDALHRALMARAVRELKAEGVIKGKLLAVLTEIYPDTTVENEPISQTTRKMMNDTSLETKKDKVQRRRGNKNQ